jgi:hypothetical protein
VAPNPPQHGVEGLDEMGEVLGLGQHRMPVPGVREQTDQQVGAGPQPTRLGLAYAVALALNCTNISPALENG